MTHQEIKNTFNSSIEHVATNISLFSVHPGKDFQRDRKIPVPKLISYLTSQGSSSTKVEMLDFWKMNTDMPGSSALNQQRSKLKPEALECLFNHFNSAIQTIDHTCLNDDYRYLAADGSTCTFFSKPSFASDDYYCSPGHSAKGVYSMHLNAFYDLKTHTYTDALIQAVHNKNEFKAFCEIVDRHEVLEGTKNVYIGDRGYCSYNNMAHVMECEQYFLLRTKDIHSKGLVSNFDFPDEETFDIDVTITLARSHSKKIQVNPETYRRVIDRASSFDFTHDTYEITFRIVRFPIGDSSYECIVTNLPREEFPPMRIKTLYYSRWGIESSFRKLKYTIGLCNFHAYKPEFIMQEIWAKLIAYNITEVMINHTVLTKRETKHNYKVNFTIAAHICRVYLRLTTEIDCYDVMLLLQKELIPIRNERQYPRLQTAHFRKPRYFTYRAA